MSFKECLNEYIKQIQCTGKELAVSSGISETVISRYRKGERMPSADSEYLKKLSDGIIKIAETKMIQDFNIIYNKNSPTSAGSEMNCRSEHKCSKEFYK